MVSACQHLSPFPMDASYPHHGIFVWRVRIKIKWYINKQKWQE